jgi:DNA-binding XRE family transcriptional regulator
MNSEKIIERLEKIFTELNLTPSMFADQIGVQRSSISHLLSGRNKPSLDLILKIFNTFPQIDLYWLLGEKELKEKINLTLLHPSSSVAEKEKVQPKEKLNKVEANLEKAELPKAIAMSKTSEVEKIVVFYRDGTFAEYAPREK